MLRLVRTASFRLTAAYASITAIAFLVLYFFTYWITTEEFDRQIRYGVEAEFSELAAVYKDSGRPEFVSNWKHCLALAADPRFITISQTGMAGSFRGISMD